MFVLVQRDGRPASRSRLCPASRSSLRDLDGVQFGSMRTRIQPLCIACFFSPSCSSASSFHFWEVAVGQEVEAHPPALPDLPQLAGWPRRARGQARRQSSVAGIEGTKQASMAVGIEARSRCTVSDQIRGGTTTAVRPLQWSSRTSRDPRHVTGSDVRADGQCRLDLSIHQAYAAAAAAAVCCPLVTSSEPLAACEGCMLKADARQQTRLCGS